MKNALNFLLPIILLLLTKKSNSQDFISKSYQFESNIPSEYVFNPKSCYSRYQNSKEYKLVNKRNQGYAMVDLLTVEQMYFKYFAFYRGGNPAEELLGEVFQNLLKKSNLNYPELNLRLDMNSDLNAYVDITGKITINLGLLAYCTNEAEIAAVISHEIAHYALSHPSQLSNDYYSLQRTSWMAVVSLYKFTELLSSSRVNELRADSLGFRIFERAGYHSIDFINFEKRLMQIETKERHRKGQLTYMQKIQGVNSYGSTHPKGANRVKFLEQLSENSNANNGKHEQFGHIRFESMKSWVSNELLRNSTIHFDYGYGIEFAFQNLLLNPDSEVYSYYLIDLLTKICFEKPELKNDLFILSNYTKKETYKGVPGVLLANVVGNAVHEVNNNFSKEESILDYISDKFLVFCDSISPKFYAELYSMRKDLRTNIQVLDYIVHRASNLKYTECNFPIMNYYRIKGDNKNYVEAKAKVLTDNNYYSSIFDFKPNQTKSLLVFDLYGKNQFYDNKWSKIQNAIQPSFIKLKSKLSGKYNQFSFLDSTWNSKQLRSISLLNLEILALENHFDHKNMNGKEILNEEVLQIVPELYINMNELDKTIYTFAELQIIDNSYTAVHLYTIQLKENAILLTILKDHCSAKKVGKLILKMYKQNNLLAVKTK